MTNLYPDFVLQRKFNPTKIANNNSIGIGYFYTKVEYD